MKTNGVPAVREPDGLGALEATIVNGDLSRLTPEQRIAYYYLRCQAAGLDPRSQPFEYVLFEGKGKQPDKLQLYAKKTATDQLIANRKISVTITDRHYESEAGCYEATCRATLPDGQQSDDIGVVFIGESQGQFLANGIMKAVTKAKRRAVLSVCGLGMLDESEVETIPGARIVPSQPVEERPQAQLESPESLPPQTEPSDLSAWMRQEIDQANAEWATICGSAKPPREYQPIIRHVRHAVNGVIKDWVERRVINRDDVRTDGKLDASKCDAKMYERWNGSAQQHHELRAAFGAYLQSSLETAAREAGINLDSEPAEVTADA